MTHHVRLGMATLLLAAGQAVATARAWDWLGSADSPLQQLPGGSAAGTETSWVQVFALLGTGMCMVVLGVWLLSLLLRVGDRRPFLWMAPVLAAFAALLMGSTTQQVPVYQLTTPRFAMASAVLWVGGGGLLRSTWGPLRLTGLVTALLPCVALLTGYALGEKDLGQTWIEADAAERALLVVTSASSLGMAIMALILPRRVAELRGGGPALQSGLHQPVRNAPGLRTIDEYDAKANQLQAGAHYANWGSPQPLGDNWTTSEVTEELDSSELETVQDHVLQRLPRKILWLGIGAIGIGAVLGSYLWLRAETDAESTEGAPSTQTGAPAATAPPESPAATPPGPTSATPKPPAKPGAKPHAARRKGRRDQGRRDPK